MLLALFILAAALFVLSLVLICLLWRERYLSACQDVRIIELEDALEAVDEALQESREEYATWN